MSKKLKPLIFDCKVCEHCFKPMTAKQYWTHNCKKVEECIVPDNIDKHYLEQAKVDANAILEDELQNARYELDDLYLEQEVLEDKIRDKENIIADLEDRLADLEQDEDANN